MQSFCHNFTGATNKKTYLTKVVKEYALIKEMSWRPAYMESYGHKMFISSQPYLWLYTNTYLTKVVKEYVLMQKMTWRPLGMESFGHKMFILSQPVLLTGTAVLYPRVRDFYF